MNNYDVTTRPVMEDDTPITVSIAISLYHILDTRWRDEYLTWNASEFGSVQSIRLPANKIWTPDLVISNYADENFNDRMITNVIVDNKGNVLWMVPALVKTYCTLNVQYFPFDLQSCEIIFISWTYSGFELNIIYNESMANTVYYNPDNQEWFVENITSHRNVKKYACCEEPYPDVTFTINMKRRSQFYVFNMIYPCVLIYLISYLGFFLPVESGEKVNLEITILLALVVFLLMVAETMPPTPDAIPVLGMFYGATMMMVSIALLMAVIVTNLYLRRDTHQKLPAFLRRLLKTLGTRSLRNMNKLTKLELKELQSDCNGDVDTNKFNADDMSIDSDDLTDYDYMACQGHFSCFKKTRRRYDSDWQILAKCVDNVLFWSYVVISVLVFFPIFSQLLNR
ncbi:unnamed protein product [Owenia fusiformis]|uniref:Uncharacterized protein n=1 Tax=Owenia fusiformis TaxID=6347 RepID=A0A8S4NXS0_OWEFU|nr:unnamed protein product [Owenia fusiformis]